MVAFGWSQGYVVGSLAAIVDEPIDYGGLADLGIAQQHDLVLYLSPDGRRGQTHRNIIIKMDHVSLSCLFTILLPSAPALSSNGSPSITSICGSFWPGSIAQR